MHVSSDAWSETNLTWSNQPGATSERLGTYWQWYEDNVADRANQFGDADKRPRLNVTYVVYP